MTGLFTSCPIKRDATGAEVPPHNRIIRHFLVYKDRLETNLLQPFAHPKNQNGFL